MRINAIRIGNNPPEDVNVIIEVPIGGEPIKYEMDKLPGGRPVPAYPDAATDRFVPHTLSDDGVPSHPPLQVFGGA